MSKGLTPWQPGQSGNPGGRPALPPEVRKDRKNNQVKLIQLITKHFNMTTKESATEARKEGTAQIEKAVRKIVEQATKGNIWAFQYLMNLMVGKIPDSDYDGATEEELILFHKVKQAMEKQDKKETLNG